jgi:Ni,Fe-hydrogenase III large subunit/Ni,Fe-hydrogenase III component G
MNEHWMTELTSRTSIDVSSNDLLERATELLQNGFRLATVAAHDDGPTLRVVYVFIKGPPDQRRELVVAVDPANPVVASLASVSFTASRFEREMRDLFGIEPVGHPQPRRLILHQHWPEGWHPMRQGAGEQPPMVSDAPPYPFIPVEGPGVYEVPVGPVHAGLIEPGHFRFFVVGETILRMKARLWFVHKGIERLVQGKSVEEALEVAQRISGDTTLGHGLAFLLAAEEALGIGVTSEDRIGRAALLEMERLYNHVADLGALCNDVAFSVANSLALTTRERLLRLNEEMTGHRLMRGALVLGGTRLRRLATAAELDQITAEVEELVSMVRSNALVLDRFAGTAVLYEADARDLGTLGVTARASGSSLDARVGHPFIVMPEVFRVVGDSRGDVLARFEVRVGEVDVSLGCLREWSERWSPSTTEPLPSRGGLDVAGWHGRRSGLGIVEGWRGTIVHRLEIDEDHRISRLKIVDPSFFNWPAVPVSLADTILPDFPLANKSFNLSYAGNDL